MSTARERRSRRTEFVLLMVLLPTIVALNVVAIAGWGYLLWLLTGRRLLVAMGFYVALGVVGYLGC